MRHRIIADIKECLQLAEEMTGRYDPERRAGMRKMIRRARKVLNDPDVKEEIKMCAWYGSKDFPPGMEH